MENTKDDGSFWISEKALACMNKFQYLTPRDSMLNTSYGENRNQWAGYYQFHQFYPK
jgi:hypothetical protein